MLFSIKHVTGLINPAQGQAILHSLGREQLWIIEKAGFYDIIVYMAAITLYTEYKCISDCFR